jgi:hypothetical protein
MDDVGDAVRRKRGFQRGGIGNVHLGEGEAGLVCQQREPVALELDDVVIVEIVDPHDLLAAV